MFENYDVLNSIFHLVIGFLSFFIFYTTKEIYELTEHRGIKYFRLSFLFFSLTLFHGAIKHFFEFDYFRFGVFFNFIGLSYIIYSLFYKKIKQEWVIYPISFFLVIFGQFIEEKYFYYLSLFSIYFLIIGFFSIKKFLSKKKHSIFRTFYLVYLILTAYWVIKYIQIIFYYDSNSFDIFNSLLLLAIFLYTDIIVCKTLRSK